MRVEFEHVRAHINVPYVYVCIYIRILVLLILASSSLGRLAPDVALLPVLWIQLVEAPLLHLLVQLKLKRLLRDITV